MSEDAEDLQYGVAPKLTQTGRLRKRKARQGGLWHVLYRPTIKRIGTRRAYELTTRPCTAVTATVAVWLVLFTLTDCHFQLFSDICYDTKTFNNLRIKNLVHIIVMC